MLLVYVAGPYRPIACTVNGDPKHFDTQYNIDVARVSAHKVARRGSDHGLFPVCPHLNTANFEDAVCGAEDSYWLEGTMEMLIRCDALVTVRHPALIYSKGTKMEIEAARELGIPVFETVDALIANVESVRAYRDSRLARTGKLHLANGYGGESA